MNRIIARSPRSAPARLWKALNVHFDNFRVWYKITYRRGRILATEGDAWRSLDVPAYIENPSLFYHGDGIVPRVEQRAVGHIAGAEVVRFTFPTLHPMKFPETNQAVGRLYRNRRVPGAPVVIISHGWAHKTLRTIEHLYVRPFVRAGFSVAFVAHPLHFERTPPGTYSGELVVSADVVLTVDAFRQGVIDMIRPANWLRAAGPLDEPRPLCAARHQPRPDVPRDPVHEANDLGRERGWRASRRRADRRAFGGGAAREELEPFVDAVGDRQDDAGHHDRGERGVQVVLEAQEGGGRLPGPGQEVVGNRQPSGGQRRDGDE